MKNNFVHKLSFDERLFKSPIFVLPNKNHKLIILTILIVLALVNLRQTVESRVIMLISTALLTYAEKTNARPVHRYR